MAPILVFGSGSWLNFQFLGEHQKNVLLGKPLWLRQFMPTAIK